MGKILITGTAGFIGYHVLKKMVDTGSEIIGIDNINDYYDVRLKHGRLIDCGICAEKLEPGQPAGSTCYPNYSFIKLDISEKASMEQLFASNDIDRVIHLAAQPGVRYSIDNPDAYVKNNITGFYNLLECCRNSKVKHLVFASSSSVYGNNKEVPFSTEMQTDHPISFYAASKKSNELMACSYSHLYDIAVTGLRFFTAYGPWGRPDMALFKFTKSIIENKPLNIFGYGEMARDFTYVEDMAEGVCLVLGAPPKKANGVRYKIYNIGNGTPVKLLDFVRTIESVIGKNAIKNMMPLQSGDLVETWADVSEFRNDFGYSCSVDLKIGVAAFIKWYREFYKV